MTENLKVCRDSRALQEERKAEKHLVLRMTCAAAKERLQDPFLPLVAHRRLRDFLRAMGQEVTK